MDNFNFLFLPNEIKHDILISLKLSDLLAIRSVCSTMYSFINDPNFYLNTNDCENDEQSNLLKHSIKYYKQKQTGFSYWYCWYYKYCTARYNAIINSNGSMDFEMCYRTYGLTILILFRWLEDIINMPSEKFFQTMGYMLIGFDCINEIKNNGNSVDMYWDILNGMVKIHCKRNTKTADEYETMFNQFRGRYYPESPVLLKYFRI